MATRNLKRKLRGAIARRQYATWNEHLHLDRGIGGTNAFIQSKDVPSLKDSLVVAVKDNFCTKDFGTTCSSAMLQRFHPPYDATVVQLLKESGAKILGKTNCDEFGMGSNNVNSSHGPVVNPFPFTPKDAEKWRMREQRSAGGSSGGSAVAVAASFCDIALGTDTGGSIRLPAAYCGISGFKPSYGIISRWGLISFADSLDCVGIMAKDVKMIERAYDIMAVHDEKDPTSISKVVRERAKRLIEDQVPKCIPSSISSARSPLNGLRIGIPKEYFPQELDPFLQTRFQRAMEVLKKAGASLHSVSLPSTPYALSTYYVLSSAEASSNLARFDGMQYGENIVPADGFKGTPGELYALTRTEHFGKEVKKRILLGTYALMAEAFDNYFLKAQKLRNRIRRDFDSVFSMQNVLRRSSDNQVARSGHGVDILVHPSAIRTAPTLAEVTSISDAADDSSLDSYLQDILTVPASLAGIPALSVPAGYGNDGWPLGITIAGQWGSDKYILRTGQVIESVLEEFNQRF